MMGNRGGIHDVMVETVGVFNDGFLKSRNKKILFTGLKKKSRISFFVNQEIGSANGWNERFGRYGARKVAN